MEKTQIQAKDFQGFKEYLIEQQGKETNMFIKEIRQYEIDNVEMLLTEPNKYVESIKVLMDKDLNYLGVKKTITLNIDTKINLDPFSICQNSL